LGDKINSSNFTNHGYVVDKVLDHNSIIFFVIENLKNYNFVVRIFYLVCSLGVIGTGWLCYKHYHALTTENYFLGFIVGLLIIIPLIPIHEGLHGLAYKICGAKTVSFGVNWKQLYFTASADMFVAGYYQFIFIGLLPFLVINIIGIYMITVVSPVAQLTIMVCLMLHNPMCAGDFSILGYFYSKRTLNPLTYDDMGRGISYFLVKTNN
jgi:putative zincin peptidase